MQITARQIDEWAAGRAAAGALLRLMRRLTLPVGDVTEMAMRAGGFGRAIWLGRGIDERGRKRLGSPRANRSGR